MYPGNHTESEILSVPRNLKTRPDAPTTHLAYITDDEDELLKKHKPGTPHKGPHDIPNYDSWDWEGGTIAQGGGFSSDSGSSEQLDYGGGPDLGGAGSTTDWSGSISNEDAFTPHDEIYGPNQAGVVQGETQYNWASINPNNNVTDAGVWSTVQNMFKSQSGMNTLEFYGIVTKDPNTGKYAWAQGTNGGKQLPVEFINSIVEGSIVSGNEAVLSDEPWIGTWDDVGSGEHPMFPGGVEDYYTATQKPFIVPYSGGVGLGGTGGYGGSGGDYGRRGGSGGGGGGGSRMQYPSPYAQGNPHRPRWGQSDIQRRYIDRMRGMNRGGIVSLCSTF